ncbi:CRISPR-associated endonuclease Csn1 [Aminicella lysinilytica]|uniref:CRISPR-associated endonuclease Cas9 n=2 Tax=Aminicella lysinilytica TaxID=433323 RepID=A0A4R6Q0N8_9FIRM|nr:CRISPR-associated endonuclease Csn1 [Aminicella lysinilytica]
MEEKYYLGLDIGTNSVGWAVTDEEYNLCKFRKKDMWGIRLFEDAETAADRRMKRTARRRLQRRNQRIDLLQELFAEEIVKVDPTFFIRLNESRLHLEDKTIKEKHPLFIGSDYSDIEYYSEYPTIYHLRKELIESKDSHDIRLVYLALHHILKNRGHFLIDGDLSAAKSFDSTFSNMLGIIKDEIGVDIYSNEGDMKECERVLKSRDIPKSTKVKMLRKHMEISEEGKDKAQIKREEAVISNACKFIVGLTGDVSKFFDEGMDELEKTSFKISDAAYDETIRDELEKVLPEKVIVMDSMKAVYDWSVLVEILGDEKYLSFAKVNQYEEHKQNLAELRRLVIKYCDSKAYKTFFNDDKGPSNYANYIGSVKKNGKKYVAKRCSQEDFYKTLKKLLAGMKVDTEDESVYESLVDGAEKQTLLPLQRSKDNGVVPRQVHEVELKKILDNAKVYLDFLDTQDESDISVADKVLSIFKFRVPYYVGPLSDRHKEEGSNSWIVRKDTGKIYPWNFDDKVDREKSNEEFINRMTNKCTYIYGADVIPKNSLLYSKYMVLNELNNVKVWGKPITVEMKQDIFNDLFMKHSRVTGTMLLRYIKAKTQFADLKAEDLSGFDKDFKASMRPYLEFENKVFGDRLNNNKISNIAEDCVKWATIYGDDKTMLANVIKQEYGNDLSEEEIKAICKLRFSGWGNFSKEFLCGVEGVDKEVATGEMMTIMQALWNTNCNLMQVLSKRFTFRDEINNLNGERIGKITEISYDALVKDMYISPANKRAVWQCILIAEEVKKIMKHPPERIFVEMARGEDKNKDRTNKNKNRTVSRKQHLLDLYAGCDKDVREWTEEIDSKDERDFNSKKLYLYYTQMGRCMYTREPIDLDALMSNNSKWDRDHIYPQSRIKDDSLDNLVLVNKTNNAKKSNEMLSGDIQKKMTPFWKELLDAKFISKKKYDRLTRKGDFTDDELAGFINRQLVETRQASKAVADLLDRIYEDTKIVYVKASLASDFRKTPLKVLKSRLINDYHHAKDAYLNIVVGNVYDAKFNSNALNWIKENRGSNYSINAIFYFDVYRGKQCVWKAPMKDENKKAMKNEHGEITTGTIDKIRKIVRQDNVLYTEYTYCAKGKLFEETIAKKTGNARIRLKKGLEISKYGGYTSANTSYFAEIEFDGKKGKRVKNIIGVPIYIANTLDQNRDAFLDYCKNLKGLSNVKILRECIKKNSLLIIDGFPMRITGENEYVDKFKGNMQLKMDEHNTESIRLIEKYFDKKLGLEMSEKYDGLSKADTLMLYDAIIDKLKCGIYADRPANQANELLKQREIFRKLNLTDEAKLLKEIIGFLRCDSKTTADMSIIGSGTTPGGIAINKNTVGKSTIIFVNQSVTGLYENRAEL